MDDTTPAGWFPDPDDDSQLRYWDGNHWTDDRATRTPVPPLTGEKGPEGPAALSEPAPIARASTKNWFLRHKILTGLLAVFALIVIASVASSGGGSNGSLSSGGTPQYAIDNNKDSDQSSDSGQNGSGPGKSNKGSDQSSNTGQNEAGSGKSNKSTPTHTVAQEQAIKAAKSYLSMGGFSRAGLIQQLSSKFGEGFTRSDAEFAVDHLKVDWNKQAVKSAKSYLKMGGFSRAGLIQQLTSQAGEQFTRAQATYAANQLGL